MRRRKQLRRVEVIDAATADADATLARLREVDPESWRCVIAAAEAMLAAHLRPTEPRAVFEARIAAIRPRGVEEAN